MFREAYEGPQSGAIWNRDGSEWTLLHNGYWAPNDKLYPPKRVKSQDWLTWGTKDNELTILTKGDIDTAVRFYNEKLLSHPMPSLVKDLLKERDLLGEYNHRRKIAQDILEANADSPFGCKIFLHPLRT